MILRKPYAFLIKRFKLIHLVMTVFMIVCLYKTFGAISFFGDYVLNESGIVGQSFRSEVYPSILFISPILVIVLSLILLAVMVAKKKPFKLYIINIVISIALLIVFGIGNGIVIELEKKLIDIRIVKLIRDFTMMTVIIQLFPIYKNLVRGVGFDLKQFDFKKDLAELEINEEDNEEVEVALSLDFNKLKRIINNAFRNFKYYYLEHKFMVSIIGAIVIVSIIGGTALGISKTNRNLLYNQPLTLENVSLKVLKTYITRQDNEGNTISNLGKQNSLVVFQIVVNNNNKKTKKELVTANMELRVAGKKYRPVSTYRDQLLDLGTTYQNELIEPDQTLRVNIVYEVPTKYINKSMELKIITSIDNTKKKLIPTYANLKVRATNLDINKKEFDLNNEEITLTDSILGNSTLKINSIEFAKQFKINYKLCLTKTNCIDSYEYINPPLNSNVDKYLMKISGSFSLDEDYKVDNLSNLLDFLNKFGTLKYTKDGTTKIINNFIRVNPNATKSSTIFYVSSPNDILDSDNIELLFNVRNKEYKYVIK